MQQHIFIAYNSKKCHGEELFENFCLPTPGNRDQIVSKKSIGVVVTNPSNGLLLCLGCMQEAGEVVPEVIRYFGERKKIFYVHFRNVVGKVPLYTEVFPDDGDGDMLANLQALKDVGFQGYLVPDHHFGITGDDADYPLISRAWQVGYIRGLLQALGK